MIAPRFASGPVLASLVLALSGCSFLSFVGLAPAAGTQVPIQLERCGTYPAALCLDSFGLGQGQLLITFYSPAAGSAEFFLKVWQGDASTTYPCTLADASLTTIYCTGPLIALGTPIKIDLYTKTGRIPLAEGEFTLNGLGVPTSGGSTPLAGGQSTPNGVASPTAVLASTPTPTSAPTPLGSTPLPGTAYPNSAYP
jgi:hypothetical protein